jgi:hypothetical protein
LLRAVSTEKEQIWWVKNDTAAYRKSEIDVFFEKLRSESPQMLKSQNLVYLHSNIPQTALVAALNPYDFLIFQTETTVSKGITALGI